MKKIIFIAVLLTLATACTKEDGTVPKPEDLGSGVFIVNEGNFNSSNASLSYFEIESRKTSNYLFFKQNNAPLGDVANDILIAGERAYIVVNNSGLIYVVNRKTAMFEGKIANLFSPRHLLILDDNKAYVSNFNHSKLTIINPEDFSITGEIEMGRSSEEMVKIGSEVFVANWSAYNQTIPNNQIMIINSEEDFLTDSITVGVEPNSMVVDKNGRLWVLCSGGFENSEKPSLWKIDPAQRQVIKTYEFPDINSSPTELEMNGESDVLYFINGAVYSMPFGDTALPTDPLIQGFSELPYKLSVDPQNNNIYLTDALDFSRNGYVYRFDSGGQILDTIETGIIPSAIGFNY